MQSFYFSLFNTFVQISSAFQITRRRPGTFYQRWNEVTLPTLILNTNVKWINIQIPLLDETRHNFFQAANFEQRILIMKY